MFFRNAICSLMLLCTALAFTAVAHAQSHDQDYITVSMQTTAGTLLIELDSKRAPQTVDNFLGYVDTNFYTDTVFHRVIEGFMIQGGGFDTMYRRKATRAPVSNEAYNGLRNERYTIAMARTNDAHSATSQFFINSNNNNNLDHTGTNRGGWGYTVFGKVVDGHDIVDAISQVKTGAAGPFNRDVPIEQIVILAVERVQAQPQVQRSTETDVSGKVTAEDDTLEGT